MPVELVDGLSEPLDDSRVCRNALNTVALEGTRVASPNVVELSLTYVARVGGVALGAKICGFSEAKASQGKVSIAYGGGPTGTPNLL